MCLLTGTVEFPSVNLVCKKKKRGEVRKKRLRGGGLYDDSQAEYLGMVVWILALGVARLAEGALEVEAIIFGDVIDAEIKRHESERWIYSTKDKRGHLPVSPPGIAELGALLL
jgi:hypothetical protein